MVNVSFQLCKKQYNNFVLIGTVVGMVEKGVADVDVIIVVLTDTVVGEDVALADFVSVSIVVSLLYIRTCTIVRACALLFENKFIHSFNIFYLIQNFYFQRLKSLSLRTMMLVFFSFL